MEPELWVPVRGSWSEWVDPTTAPDRMIRACWGRDTKPKASRQSLGAVCFSLVSRFEGSHSQKNPRRSKSKVSLSIREKRAQAKMNAGLRAS